MKDSRGVVLLVEDDVDVREAVSEQLDQTGFSVVAVRDGRAAIDYLVGPLAKPRAILLDLMMPELSGWEFLEWLKQRRELDGVRVIVHSAATDAAIREAQASGRVDRVLAKPFDPQMLEKVVLQTCATG